MLRQAIAMVIFIYGLKYVVTSEFGKYLLIVLLATSFHLTAIVALLLHSLLNISRCFVLHTLAMLTDYGFIAVMVM